MNTKYLAIAATLVLATSQSAFASSHPTQGAMMSNGLILPSMNASEGRELFASKGCVVCHSINGIGGEDARPLDAEFMEMPMNPFDFAARMWRGAPAMIEAQEDELGYQIELTGEELGAIIAFVHDPDEQSKFSEADIPHNLKEMMEHLDEEEEDHD